jgi:hypothetical protein
MELMIKEPTIIVALISACSAIFVAIIGGIFMIIASRNKSAENSVSPERNRITNVRESVLPSENIARRNLLKDLAEEMPIAVSRPDIPLGSVMTAFGGFIVGLGVLSSVALLASASWIESLGVAFFVVGIGYLLIRAGFGYHRRQIAIGRKNGDVIIALQRRLLQEPGFDEYLFTDAKIAQKRDYKDALFNQESQPNALKTIFVVNLH